MVAIDIMEISAFDSPLTRAEDGGRGAVPYDENFEFDAPRWADLTAEMDDRYAIRPDQFNCAVFSRALNMMLCLHWKC